MKIYLLRHGTTEWNEARRLQGKSDIRLDAMGERMARITGEKLAAQGIRFRYVFSSPLQRAHRTAELAAPGVGIQSDPRLAELAFGRDEGRTAVEMMADETCPFRYFHPDPARYDEVLRRLEEEEPDRQYESLASLTARAGRFIEEVIVPLAASEPADTNVLISGHGGVNRALMMHFLNNKDLSGFWGRGLQANCGITVIDACASSGGVTFETDDESRVYYDPEEFRVPKLLG